jgi:uncharacterized protein (DUF433 family)
MVVIRAKVDLIVGMKKNTVVMIDHGIMSGEPCFASTRVPVRALLDYIEGGKTLDEFLEQYPTVLRKQAVAFLEQSSNLSHGGVVEVRPMRDGKNSIVLLPKPTQRRGAVGLRKLFARCPVPIPPPERHYLPFK